MKPLSAKHSTLALAATFCAGTLSAQTPEEVKSDVLSALSTPLPITIIGPLLTPDVIVTAEGDGFRATLQNTSLLGFFPIGEVSLKLTPIDDDTYRITDLTLPQTLDFPGLARVTHSAMELSGTWSSASRSYSDLHWNIEGLSLAPEGAPGGAVSLGALTFDVTKEPDEADTESRFQIAARDVSVTGLMPDNLSIGTVEARLAANGEEPVDLYSVIRETIMRANMRDGGAGLQSLAASLLGKSYKTVSLDLSAGDLDITSAIPANTSYFRSKTMAISASLADVAPRQWGAADITISLGALEQQDMAADGSYAVEEAALSLRGGELPVADMFNAFTILSNPRMHRPVMASALLDGLASFGKIEIATSGRTLAATAMKRIYPSDSSKPVEKKSLFTIGYESWNMQLGFADLIRNEGKIAFSSALSGGSFTPGEAFPQANLPDIEAWFPLTLDLRSVTSNLNEGFLKTLFKDVSINDLNEPAEIILPLVLYTSATVLDMQSGENAYETALFRISNSGSARFYPTEAFGLFPYEGESTVRMAGFDRLLGYVEKLPMRRSAVGPAMSESSIIRSVMIVLRNLATRPDAETLEWAVSKPSIERTEILVNGTTFRYPDIMEFMPLMMGSYLTRF